MSISTMKTIRRIIRQWLRLWQFLLISTVPFCSIRYSNERISNRNASLFCRAEEFNTQIMARVTERLDDFMDVPIKAIHRLLDFRRIGSFPNGMTAADHDLIYRYLLMEKKSNTTLYVGLEDGSFFYTIENVTVYREPGNDGYIVDTIDSEDLNYKHYVSCISKNTFQQTSCIATNGTSYISCISNCTLVPCLSSQQSAAPTEVWCSNYTIMQVNNDTDANVFGYIPRLLRCSNRHGLPEQRPGFVVGLTDTQLGNCYYADGITLVNRSIEGRYAACGQNISCSIPNTGAVASPPYDPRYRRWYIEAKHKQQPTWTAPYAFTSPVIGITYTHPLYNDITSLTDDEVDSSRIKMIFQGVVAVDYTLDKLNAFLSSQYSETKMLVLIVERTGPEHYVVAISTGTDVVQLVLASDPTQPCPLNANELTAASRVQSRVCDVIRVPISALGSSISMEKNGSTDNDDQRKRRQANLALFRAFMSHKAAGFPDDSQLHVKESPNTIGSPAYVAQGHLYQLGGGAFSKMDRATSNTTDAANIQWQILVVVPMPRRELDAALPGDTSFMITCMIATIGFVSCFVTFVKFYTKRREKAMIHADWIFTSAFILGSSTLNLSTFALLGENTDSACMLRMWSFNGLFACALSPLFVKVWRMSMLLKVEVSYQRKSLNNFRAFLYTLPLIMTQLAILFIFSLIDPPRQTEHLGVGDGVGYQQITCEQQSNAFFYTQVIYDALLICVGCVLAYKTKDLDPKFGEAKQLAFSMYNVAFTGIIIVSTIRLVDFDRVSQIIIQAIGVFWGSFFCCFAFVLPRLLEVKQFKRDIPSNSYESSYLQTQDLPRINSTPVDAGETKLDGDAVEPLKPISAPPVLHGQKDFDIYVSQINFEDDVSQINFVDDDRAGLIFGNDNMILKSEEATEHVKDSQADLTISKSTHME